jgi:hypothetical protein
MWDRLPPGALADQCLRAGLQGAGVGAGTTFMGGGSWLEHRDSWRWSERGCCRRRRHPRWRRWCGSFSHGAGALDRVARGVRMTTRSPRCWPGGRRPVRAPWCFCRVQCLGDRNHCMPSWQGAGASCWAPGPAGSPSSGAHGGSRGNRLVWSPSSGGRRVAHGSRCGKRSGRGSRLPWCWAAVVPCCRRSPVVGGCRAASVRSKASGGTRNRRSARGLPGSRACSKCQRASPPTPSSSTSRH